MGTDWSIVYKFIPPTVEEGPMGAHWLFYRYKLTRGLSVLKIDGVYYEIRTPSQDEMAVAEVIYQGGHEYIVDEAEATALQNAGYTVSTI